MAKTANETVTGELIKKRAMQDGADIVGIAPAERLQDEPEGTRPTDLLPGAKAVISVGMRQLRAYMESAPSTNYFMFGYRQKNDYVSTICADIAAMLDKEGYYALPVPSWGAADLIISHGKAEMRGIFSNARAAAVAGLGEMGLSGLFLSSVYGPRIWLGSVITTAPLTADPPFSDKLCDRENCRECIKQCPANAIGEDGVLNAVDCVIACDKLHTSYDETVKQMLERQETVDPLVRIGQAVGYTDYKGYGFCGLACINACPVGKKELV